MIFVYIHCLYFLGCMFPWFSWLQFCNSRSFSENGLLNALNHQVPHIPGNNFWCFREKDNWKSIQLDYRLFVHSFIVLSRVIPTLLHGLQFASMQVIRGRKHLCPLWCAELISAGCRSSIQHKITVEAVVSLPFLLC